MIINKTNGVCTITQEKLTSLALVKAIETDYEKFSQYHIIVNLTQLKTVSHQEIIEFLRISKTHNTAKKSFVIVSHTAIIDDMPDEILVVPTLQEAYDIIEMEEIERDLGF